MHKKMQNGGHFAALEQPTEYVANIAEFIDKCNELEKKEEVKDDGVDVIDLIDTHIHLWDVKTAKRKWLESKDMESINKNYTAEMYMEMYEKAKNVNLKCGIFMETDVENDDIETEVNEITMV